MSLLLDALMPLASGIGMDWTNGAYWTSDVAQNRRTLSGSNVSPSTALTLSSYFACIRCIAEDIGKISLILYQGQDGDGKRKVPATSSPLYRLLKYSPSAESTSQVFRETLTANALGWGNGYAEIQRTTSGKPVALWPIHPSRVTVKRLDGRLVYDVMSSEWQAGATVRLEARDVLHIHGVGEDGIMGISIARMAAESIGLGLSMQDFGASYFGNGSHSSVIIMHPGKYSEPAEKALRESWQKMYSGPENAHKTAVLWEGTKLERTSIPPNEAQFLEGRQFQVEEICRWFRMPPHKVQHLLRATFANIEHLDIEYVRDTLMPWLVRWEHEISRKLMSEADQLNYTLRHHVADLMRGDSVARSNYIRTMISTGAMSPNEAREMEDLNPMESEIGDQFFMQGAMTTVEKIVTQPAPVNASSRPGKQTPTQRPEDDEMEDEEDDEDEMEDGMDASIFLPIFSDADARVARKEKMALTNALRKHPKPCASLNVWVDDFYAEHAGYIVAAFKPALDTVRAAGISADDQHLMACAQRYCQANAVTAKACMATSIQAGTLADSIMAPLMVKAPKQKPEKQVASVQPIVMNITVDDSNAQKSLSVQRGTDGRITGVAATSTKTKTLAIARDDKGNILGMAQ